MTKNTMSWIIVALLVLIIALLSLCIYLDIEFVSSSTPTPKPSTAVSSTTTEPIINTLNPVHTTKTLSTSEAPASSALPTPQTSKPAQTEAPKPPETTLQVFASQAPITTQTPQVSPDAPTICIDPGHGFSDPGTVHKLAATGVSYNEKDINLAIALKLKEELLALGYNVIMTHDGVNLPEAKYLTKNKNGTFFYVNERNQWIRDRKDEIDLVISIHCDSADPSVSGTRFYIMQYGTSYYLNSSEQLAKSLCNAVATAFGKTPPTSKYNTTTELAILKTGVCSVLVEAAFMSNNGDLTKLIDPAWQTTFAQGLAQGVKNHLTK